MCLSREIYRVNVYTITILGIIQNDQWTYMCLIRFYMSCGQQLNSAKFEKIRFLGTIFSLQRPACTSPPCTRFVLFGLAAWHHTVSEQSQSLCEYCYSLLDLLNGCRYRRVTTKACQLELIVLGCDEVFVIMQ